jgi:Fic family protein
MEYCRRLANVRIEGDWEGWVSFLLQGVAEAERSVIEIAKLVATDRRRLLAETQAYPASYRSFELLQMMPRLTIERVRQELDTSFPTATAAVKQLEALGIIVEQTGLKRNRSYGYRAYIALLNG